MISTGLFPLPTPSGGGVERNVLELTLSLAKLGHSVTLVSDVSDRDIFPANVEIIPVHTPDLNWCAGFFGWIYNFLVALPFNLRAINKALKKNNFMFDIAHSHDLLSTLFVLKKVRKRGIRFFYTNHSPLYRVKLYAGIKKWIRKIGYEHIGIMVWRNVDHLFVHGRALRDELVDFFKVPAERITLLYQGVNIGRFSPDNYDNKILEKYGLQPGYCLFVGHLTKRKGTNYLMEGLRQADVACAIVGDGPEKQAMIRCAQREGFSGRISFIGSLPSDSRELKALYAGAGFFVFPTMSEGAPLVIPEALASGLPVIAFDTSGIGELIISGFNGYLIDSGERHKLGEYIRRAASDKDTLAKMRDNAVAFARSHNSFDAIAGQICSVYESEIKSNDAQQ